MNLSQGKIGWRHCSVAAYPIWCIKKYDNIQKIWGKASLSEGL